MKTLIQNYVFNKTAKTITFLDYSSIELESILLITNVTDHISIYNFADDTLKGTVLNNVLTLQYDTSSMDNSDDIQIYYDDTTKQQATEESVSRIRRLLKMVSGLAIKDSGGRIRMTVDTINGGTVTTVSTVTTVTGVTTVTTLANLTNFGLRSADYMQQNIARNTYANNSRKLLSFS